MQSYHENRNLRKHLRDLSGYVHPIQIGHLVIQNNQVRLRLEHLVQGLRAVPGLARDAPRFLLLENRPQVTADSWIVINDKNTNQAKASRSPIETKVPRGMRLRSHRKAPRYL